MNTMLRVLAFLTALSAYGFAAAQSPVAYRGVLERTHGAEFDFEDLDRDFLETQPAPFYVTERVEMTFHILIRPDGSVGHVRVPRVEPDLFHVRKVCADALYGHVFTPVADSAGGQWVRVTMVAEP